MAHRTRRRHRRRIAISYDAIIVALCFAVALPIIVQGQIIMGESKRILAEMEASLHDPTPADGFVRTVYTEPPAPAASAEPEPTINARYAGITMTDGERQEILAVIFLEAADQCPEGQQAVAEVILNRVISPDFPDTVHEVLHQKNPIQFSTAENIPIATPTEAQETALEAALYGDSILPADVVFFSQEGENDRVYATIQDHVFCYGYEW